MRIAINMPLQDSDGVPLDAKGIMRRARMVEDAGLDGIWMGDGISPNMTRPDALMWLLVACAATDRIEVGTSILQIPLRNPVELAQRFLTLQALTRGRFTVGVGAGSTKSNHDRVQHNRREVGALRLEELGLALHGAGLELLGEEFGVRRQFEIVRQRAARSRRRGRARHRGRARGKRPQHGPSDRRLPKSRKRRG
jgi:luciferase-like monooxygenase